MNVLSQVGDAGQGGISRGKKGGTSGNFMIDFHIIRFVHQYFEAIFPDVYVMVFSPSKVLYYLLNLQSRYFEFPNISKSVEELYVLEMDSYFHLFRYTSCGEYNTYP